MIYKISPSPSFPKRGKEKEEIPNFPVQRAFFGASAEGTKILNFVGKIG
jgi:hypothetical protein